MTQQEGKKTKKLVAVSSPQRGYFETATSASEFLLFYIEHATRPVFSLLNLGAGTAERATALEI